MDAFFFIQYTGHGWGLAMTGSNVDTSVLNTEVPGTRTIFAPAGAITTGEAHTMAILWNEGDEDFALPEGATLHKGPAK